MEQVKNGSPPNGNVAELVNAPALKAGCQKWLVCSNHTVAVGFLCQRNSFHPIADAVKASQMAVGGGLNKQLNTA